MISTVLLSIAGATLILLQAGGTARIISDVFLGGANFKEVTPLFLLLIGIILARGAVSGGAEISAASMAVRIKQELRGQVLPKIFRLGPAYLGEGQSGEISSTITQGIESIDAYFSQFIPQIILAALIPIMILVVVFPLDWISGLTLLLTAPLIPFFLYLIGRATERVTGRQFTALSRMSAFFLDTLHALATIKQFGKSRQRLDEVRSINDDYSRATMAVLQITFLSALALEMLGTLSTALIAVQIGLRLLRGAMVFEQALFILIITPEFYLPLRNLGLRYHASMNGVSAAGRIFAILDRAEPGESPQHQLGEQPERIELPNPDRIEVQFDTVRYQHPERNNQVLDGVSFTIPPGGITALVGRSGAGKSTIIQLLLRFIVPGSGFILVNGVPLESIPAATWRRSIAWVPQQASLFEDTILENLRVANPMASQESAEQAAKKAGIHDLISALPDGYHTLVGEGGARFSGGERSRIAIARAFLRDAPFLILDEPTANLDVESETAVQNAVMELSRGRTVLIIAHRLNTIRVADRVMQLDDGRISSATGAKDYLSRISRLDAAFPDAEGENP